MTNRRIVTILQNCKLDIYIIQQHRVNKPQCDQKKFAKCLLKLPKNDFTRKMIDFDTFTKIAKECGRFGQIAKGLKKVAQSPINCPIWSH